MSNIDDQDDGPDTCERCHRPFDPSDARFDGHAQYSVSPYCRRCVGFCHGSTDAFHACVICDPSPTDRDHHG